MSSKSFKKIQLSSEVCCYVSKCKLFTEIMFCNFSQFYFYSFRFNNEAKPIIV